MSYSHQTAPCLHLILTSIALSPHSLSACQHKINGYSELLVRHEILGMMGRQHSSLHVLTAMVYTVVSRIYAPRFATLGVYMVSKTSNTSA